MVRWEVFFLLFIDVLGLRCKVLVVGGGYGGGFFPTFPEPMPDGSKKAPTLAKAKSVSTNDGGTTSGIVYLQRGGREQNKNPHKRCPMAAGGRSETT